MDNLGVRLPVDATTKSKFKAKGLTSQMKEKCLLIPEKRQKTPGFAKSIEGTS